MNVHNLALPTQPTAFLGRGKELTEISQSLRGPSCRSLTLTGPDGVGKTRLAVQAAYDIADVFDRGAFFINLGPVGSADHLVSTIANSNVWHC